MSPDFNAGFVILDAVTVPDIIRGRRIAGLCDSLTDEDALRALQCLARNDEDFAAYMESMRKFVAVSALVYDGQSFAMESCINIKAEQDCLSESQEMCRNWSREYKQYSLDADLLAHLHLRTLIYEENWAALFELDVTAVGEVLPALKDKNTPCIRLWVRDVLGNDDGWLKGNELEAFCLQGQEKPIERHCRAKLRATCQLFMKYWVASGTLSKVKYRSLSKALDALFAAHITNT